MQERGGASRPSTGASNHAAVASSFWRDLVACEGDVPGLLRVITKQVSDAVGEASALTVVSDDGTVLDPVATYHPDPDMLALIRSIVESGPFPVGEGIVGRVAADRTPALLNGIDPVVTADFVHPRGRMFAERHPIHSLLIVPMVASGELVGTLGVVRTDSTAPYTSEDVLTVEAMAERAALAIADARRRPSVLGAEDFEAIYRHSPDAILFTAPDGRVLAANAAACVILGLTEAEICRRGRAGLLLSDDPATVAAVEARARTGHVRAEVLMRRGSGAIFTADISSTVFLTAHGELRACVIFRDVSEQVALREQLRQQAMQLEEQIERDPLTNLRNRRGFVSAAEEAMAIAKRDGKYVQLVFFDLDQLKHINDTLGHRAGDGFIQRFADALAGETRDADVSARLGGDEFALLLFSATRADADQIVTRIRGAFAHAQRTPAASFSAGIAEWISVSGEPLPLLLERADRAMYEAKLRRRFGSGDE